MTDSLKQTLAPILSYYSIAIDDLTAKTNKRAGKCSREPLQIAILYLRNVLKLSNREIAAEFGYKDKSIVTKHTKRAISIKSVDKDFARRYQLMEAEIPKQMFQSLRQKNVAPQTETLWQQR